MNEAVVEQSKDEKLRLIQAIMAEYVKNEPQDKCGDRFDKLYEKSLEELKIYYQVFK